MYLQLKHLRLSEKKKIEVTKRISIFTGLNEQYVKKVLNSLTYIGEFHSHNIMDIEYFYSVVQKINGKIMILQGTHGEEMPRVMLEKEVFKGSEERKYESIEDEDLLEVFHHTEKIQTIATAFSLMFVVDKELFKKEIEMRKERYNELS